MLKPLSTIAEYQSNASYLDVNQTILCEGFLKLVIIYFHWRKH